MVQQLVPPSPLRDVCTVYGCNRTRLRHASILRNGLKVRTVLKNTEEELGQDWSKSRTLAIA